MRLNEAYDRFRDDIQFFNVYIAEAHASDGWALFRNMDEGIVHEQPTTVDERAEIAQVCLTKVRFKFPTLIDDIDDAVDIAYAAHPVRIYVIDRDGRVYYRTGMGPRDLDIDASLKAIEEQAALVG